jgi:hypothetical protein
MTPSQIDEPDNAPWTRTTVDFVDVGVAAEADSTDMLNMATALSARIVIDAACFRYAMTFIYVYLHAESKGDQICISYFATLPWPSGH